MITLPFMHREREIGLDISNNWVRLAQAEKTSKARRVVKLGARQLASQEPEDISAAVNALLKELKIDRRGRLFTSIPRHRATVRFLRLPSALPQEIRAMVDFEAAKQIPYPKEEIIYDYKIMGTDEQGYTEIMLVLVHRDVAAGYLRVLKALNLKPQYIGLTSEDVFNWYQSAKAGEINRGPVALIDIDYSAADIEIVDNNKLSFTRGISFGSMHLCREADIEARLFEEIRRSFEAYTKQAMGKEAVKIVLAGGVEGLPALSRDLESAFSLPVEVIAPLKNIPCEGISLSPDVQGVSFSASLGMVLPSREAGINLLPAELRKKQEWKEKKRAFITGGVLLFCIILVSASILAKRIKDKEDYLAQLGRRLEEISPLSRDVEEKMRKVELIKERLELADSSIDILRELYSLIPPQISLSLLNFEYERQISLQGMSQDMADVFKFITVLEKSLYFRKVEIKYARKRKVKGKELTDFELLCSLGEEGKKN